MIIRARFFGDFQAIIKKRGITMDLPPGSSVRDFLLTLANNHDPLAKFLENDNIGSKTTILLNGRNIRHLKWLETKLKDRDLLSFLAIAGGG